ncbi:MAG: hypothetical protein GY835_25185 [bacterium]|nr:hypothetical protein [bacterium]
MMKILMPIIVILLLSSTVVNIARAGSGPLTVGMEYQSLYLARGFDFYGEDRGVLLPWVGYSKNGFGMSVWGEMSPDILVGEAISPEKEWAGVDFNTGYRMNFMEDRLGVELGTWLLWYPNDRNEQEDRIRAYYEVQGTPEANRLVNTYDQDFVKGYVKFTFPGLLLSPGLLYTQQYFLSDHGKTRSKDASFYIILSGGHSTEISERTDLGLGASITYFRYDPAEVQGISEISLFARLSTSFENGLGLVGGFNYTIVPLDEVAGTNPGNHHKFHSTFGIMYSFPMSGTKAGSP